MLHTTENPPFPTLPGSSLGLFLCLWSGLWRPGKFWHQRSFRRKFMLRSLFMPRLTRQWMAEMARWPDIERLLLIQPRLPVRLHRPYLAVNFDRQQLLDALRYHYATLRNTLTDEELQHYFAYAGIPLADIEGKGGEIYTLHFASVISLDKEGESTILLRNARNEMLAEITFTICEYEGKRTLFIGGLQGGKTEQSQEDIHQATKACHGLFPKRVVMEAVCSFARRWQITQILAVSNQAHIYRSLRYRDKENKIHADYDDFWQAVGGVSDNQGYYHLPLTIARKDETEIASKKRAEYRRRYALLDGIDSQIRQRFNR
ncbi:VirK/YbjX family protein [Pseudocitrobacter cyperus]|uniref:VirK/YbjX family protein n=1 Tax=Pseudocitrobacter cyperus TaxID=3112843 RepID=A0ABV0HGP1_9ENTR